jgi:type IV pilus assembly protein PilM
MSDDPKNTPGMDQPEQGAPVPPPPAQQPVMPPAPPAQAPFGAPGPVVPPVMTPPAAVPPAPPLQPIAPPAAAPAAPPPAMAPPVAPAPPAAPVAAPPPAAAPAWPAAPQLPVPPVEQPAASAPVAPLPAAAPVAPAAPAFVAPLVSDDAEDEPAAKVPWYKKELGGGGKDKAPKAKKDKTPKAKKRKGDSAVAAAIAVEALLPGEDAPAQKTPWYKLEVGGGGGKKKKAKDPAPVATAVPPVDAPAVAAAPAAPAKTPWYKLEVGGKKKDKAAAAEVALAATAALPAILPGGALDPDGGATPAATAVAKLSLRDRLNGRGKKPAAAVPDANGIVLAPEPKKPIWKREIGGDKGDKMLRDVLGLKIGASQIAAAKVTNSPGGQPELVQIARERLERGIVVGGELRDPNGLALALGDFFKKHRLPKKNVRLGVANNRVNVRILDIAGAAMSPKQLENAIRFRAQEALPIAIDDAVLDYQVLSQNVNAEGELVHRVLLVVAYRDLIDRYVEACRKAGIRLVGIDLEAFALLRALTVPNTTDGRPEAAQVVVSVGHDRSTFAVSDGKICEFTRVLDWGGSALDIAIARQLNLTPSDAEPIKWAVSLDNTERALPEGISPDQVTQATEVVRRQLQTFARELVSSLQFYQNQPGSLGIGEIVITGGTAQMPGLAAELQRLIGVVVRVGDPTSRVQVSKRIRDTADAGSLAVAIGLGIEV